MQTVQYHPLVQTQKAWSWSLDLTECLRKPFYIKNVRCDYICTGINLVTVISYRLFIAIVRKITIPRLASMSKFHELEKQYLFFTLFVTIRDYLLFVTVRVIPTIPYSLFATILHSLFGFSRHPALDYVFAYVRAYI